MRWERIIQQMGPQIGCFILDRRSAGVGWLEKWTNNTKQIWKKWNEENGGGGGGGKIRKLICVVLLIEAVIILPGKQAVITMWKHRGYPGFMWIQTEVVKMFAVARRRTVQVIMHQNMDRELWKCQKPAVFNLFSCLDIGRSKKNDLFKAFPCSYQRAHLNTQNA